MILLCRILRTVGRWLGRGSSLPGEIVLKLDPTILQRVTLPKYIVAVTGSNGKTSTVEMIAKILTDAGMKVAYNREGSNQIQGVTTLILSNCNLKGQVQADVLLIESDERYARFTFRHFSPTHFVITNLYRDQMTRNGHPEWIYDIIDQSVQLMGENTNFLLNADDPLVSRFGQGKQKVTWFGVGETPDSHRPYDSLYDDGAHCPVCKGKMVYNFRHFAAMGDYRCLACGYHREKPQFEATDLQLSRGYLTINGQTTIHLALKSMYNVYNVLAAFTVASLLGVQPDAISDSISDYVLTNGRVVSFHMGEHQGLLLTSKHENSTSYNQSIQLATAPERDCTILVIVQAISRKYFTSDTSWLWDIDFEKLNVPCVKKILLAGTYCWDLAARFDYTGIAPDKIVADPSIDQAMETMRREGVGDLYVITCLSDKDKFLTRLRKEELE